MSASKTTSYRGNIRQVLIVDDHPLYVDALTSALKQNFGGCETRSAATLSETIKILEGGFDPDLIMFDLKLPDVKGISGFRTLKTHAPNTPVLVISSLASVELITSLIESGANGFLPKDSPSAKLKLAIDSVSSGRRYLPKEYQVAGDGQAQNFCAYRSNPELSKLSAQQIRILKLICAGLPNKQIAYELSLAEATVKAHITALLRRLGVTNRTHAVIVAESAMARHGGSEPEARAFLNH